MFSRQGWVIQVLNSSCLLNSLRLSIHRRGGSSPLRFVERQDEGRARGCAPVPGQGIGAAIMATPYTGLFIAGANCNCACACAAFSIQVFSNSIIHGLV